MARPVKWRRIDRMPSVRSFEPVGPHEAVGANILKLEELEAIRLKDLEGLEQEDCARQMGVSRPTFQRILLSAREKIADSLVQGKGIRFEGGHYTRGIYPVRCLACGKEWTESEERLEDTGESASSCPRCHSDRLQCCPDDDSETAAHCRRRMRHHGQPPL
jgi:predicted DNA-binding protein (UPF0251 family)